LTNKFFTELIFNEEINRTSAQEQIMSRSHLVMIALFVAALCAAPGSAKEFYVGEPIESGLSAPC
jgi:hypothetical protein